MPSTFNLPLGMGLSASPEQEIPAKYASLDGWGNVKGSLLPIALLLVMLYLASHFTS